METRGGKIMKTEKYLINKYGPEGEIHILHGNKDMNIDGWKLCMFVDNCGTYDRPSWILNHELAYWKDGGIEWASRNGKLDYFQENEKEALIEYKFQLLIEKGKMTDRYQEEE
mgnify:CR=1 FL=1|tara:strand:+ start:1578 stop:1916 length:339 start_codon:yes stop_codon:yes gene_type:complete